MKGKRWVLVAVLLVVLVVGWFTAVKSLDKTDVLEAQQALVEQADMFAAKELYVRAVPLYSQALTYHTELNPQIEVKLLDIYIARGDTASYEQLVEKRVQAGTATEAEYLRTARFYLAEGGFKKAMELLKKGMTAYPEGEIGELYEDNRYNYSMRVTQAVKLIPTSGNGYMPAYDGEKWGFMNPKGMYVIPAVYDSVIPFNSRGFSVVSKDGVYYTIVDDGDKYGIDETHVTDVYGLNASYIIAQCNGKYSYYNMDFVNVAPSLQFDEMTMNSSGVATVRSGDRWAVMTDAGEMLTDYIYEDVAVNSLGQVFVAGRGMVKQNGRWQLVKLDEGKLVQVTKEGFADAKAPEADNYIAVADSKGYWGFIDKNGDQIIDFVYNDAKSFSNRLAAVQVVTKWGYISERNELVIEDFLEDAEPFHNYIAQGVFQGQAAVLTLDYQEN